MEIMIFCGIYLVELICYLTVLRMLFDVQVRLRVWMTAGFMLFITNAISMPIIINILPVNAEGKNVLITINVIMAIFLSIEGRFSEKGVRLVLTFLLVECLHGIFLEPCEKLFLFVDNYYRCNIEYLGIKFCTIISIFILYIVKKRIRKSKKIQINSIIYMIIGIIAISMIFCLGILNHVKSYLSNNYFIVICKILNVSISLSIFLLVVFIIYIKNTHERMELLLKTERLLKESQVSYYKQVLKKEIDTRKYRHDMMNHLVCIYDLLNRKKIVDAQRYLDSILGGFKKIQNSYLITGNEMVDTIMNYFFGMLPENVKIDIKGKCPVIIDMDETEVCTVFSNIFQNAVEEITENNILDAEIIVEISKGKQYIEYIIKNTLTTKIGKDFIDKNGLPKSHKPDKRNHGIGMVNVKKAIERNNGKFEWDQSGRMFCVYVVLPIK